jgi:hypothetical protein
MARIFKNIEIGGKDAFVLFDTGSFRSYVREEFASNIRQKVPSFKVGLGGDFFDLDEVCLLNCAIEGLGFDVKAYPVEEIGKDECGGEIDAIIGATAMEEWSLIPDPKTGSIDLTAFRKREFIEF